MRPLASIILLACALCPPGSAQSGLALIQPDAGVVFGVEWRRILDSPAGAQLAEQFKKNDLAKVPGFDGIQDALLRDVESLVVAAPASSLSQGAAMQSAGLIVVKGRFDMARLRSVFGASHAPAEMYRSVELMGAAKGASGASARNAVFGLLDAGTLLGGDRVQVRAAIDRARMGRVTQPHTGILAGIGELAANNDIWMVATIPPGATKDVPQPMGQMLANVKSTEIGMSFREGLTVHMNVRAKDEASATQVFQMIQGLIGMAALSQNQNPQAAEMLKKLQISSEGVQVKLALSIDQSELDKMVKEAQTARVAGPTPQRPAPANGIPPPEAPKPNTVRITGLDGGPVEVPISGAKK